MRPPESFIGQPIRDLQTMLRVIAIHRNLPVPLVPDGIYGASTMQAVSDFQKTAGLPPTGAADQVTWDAILNAYLPAKVSLAPAQPLYLLSNANVTRKSGDEHPNIYIVQAVLQVLSMEFKSILKPSFNGILDRQTGESILSFQVLSGLPATGVLDKITWKNLALQYPLAASLSQNGRMENPPQQT